MQNSIRLITLTLLTVTAFACGRAEWQETGVGAGSGTVQGAPTDGTPIEKTPLDPGHPPIMKPAPNPFETCKSQSLEIQIATSKGDKSNAQDVATTLARYPRMKMTRASESSTKTVFYLTAHDGRSRACQSKACAEQAGWTALQNDLYQLNGVTVLCLGAPREALPQEPAPTPSESGSGEGRG